MTARPDPGDFLSFALPLVAPSVEALNRAHEGLEAEAVLREAIEHDFAGGIALVSSFGAESAVLLHMVAEIDPATPVLFLETGMLFSETLAYQQDLAARLGLSDLRLICPDAAEVASEDAAGGRHIYDPDGCCDLRKVRPLERALAPFDAWITGRKRGQSETRANLSLYEDDAEGRVKINPLADWDAPRVRSYMIRHELPFHPLVARGFPSIGCAPCTRAVAPGENPRAGRWAGTDKTECGIHFADGKLLRRAG